MLSGKVGRVLPVAVPFLLAVVLFAPATLGGKVLAASNVALYAPPFSAGNTQPSDAIQSDSGFVFESDGLLVRDALRHLRLPVWTPAASAGLPLLADQQSAPLFPLTWIDVVFPYWHSLVWIKVLLLTLAALGTYLLARALGLRRGPALLGGVAFAFGTYLLVWLMHPHSNAYMMLPWVFFAIEVLCRRRTVWAAAALGGALGIAFLGGQPESSLLVSLAAVGWFVHRLIGASLSRRESVRLLLLAAFAGVLGVMLGAVMLLPFVEALHQSYSSSRAGPPLAAKAIITLFFPKYWGVGGPSNFTERTLYLGALPTLLAAAGLLTRRPRGPRLFFAGLAVVALAVALNTGPLSRAVRHLPVLDQANLVRALILASFAISMLAAFGFQQLLDGTAAERRRMLIVAAVVGLLPVIAVIGGHPSWWGDLPSAVRHGGATAAASGLRSSLRWLVFAAAAVALLFALTRWPRHRAVLIAAAIALTAGDLLQIGQGYNPSIPEAQANPPAPPAVAVMRRLTAGGGRVVGIGGLEPNTASRWGLEDARGHEDPSVGRIQRLWYALGGGVELNSPGVDPDNAHARKLLDVFGVRAILLKPEAVRGSKPVLPAPLRGLPVAYSGPGGVVLENPQALPPAFVAYRWRQSPSQDASLLLTAVRTVRQARDQPVIETSQPSPGGAAPPATPARVVSRTDTSVTLDVRAHASGQLILTDTYYPGWHAEVDGHSVPISAADAAFRAIPVPAGHHTVRFYYRPTSVIAGGVLSIVSLLAILTCIALGWWRGASAVQRARRRTALPREPEPVEPGQYVA